jgi:hypothetical protein
MFVYINMEAFMIIELNINEINFINGGGGIASGLTIGLLSDLIMIPLEIPDKNTAIVASFASRFVIGFLIPNTHFFV